MNQVLLAQVTGRELLGGRTAGLVDLPKLELAGRASRNLLVIDFRGIETISASYIGAAFLPLLRGTSALGSNIYVVFRNLGPELREDLGVPLVSYRASALEWTPGESRLYQPLGLIEQPYLEHLDVVVAQGAVTANEMTEIDSTLSRTGWSNRLIELFNRRLIRREKISRTMHYVPLWKGVADGN